jgi:hypothetical protein
MILPQSFLPVALALLWLAASAHSSLYDPHVPSKGKSSFFEGWYTRIIAADGSSSFAILFGLTHPGTGTSTGASDSPPSAIITIAYHDNVSPASSMQAFTALPPAAAVTVTRHGLPVASNPDFKTPPDFRWDAGEFGYQETRGNVTTMNFTVVDASFYAELTSVTPWTSDSSGFGPSSALDALPIPLHWFVFSLSSTVSTFSFTSSQRTLSAASGRAHMEKNWGQAFPAKWIWAQALDGSDGNATGRAAFAFSGGDLEMWGDALTINTSHFAGYRDASNRIAWNFTPFNSRMTFSLDACNGSFSFELSHNLLPHHLVVTMTAPASSLRTCLLCPAPGGFLPMSTETFSATIEITLLTRRFGRLNIVEHVIMQNAALEFGGLYRCTSPDPCEHLSARAVRAQV